MAAPARRQAREAVRLAMRVEAPHAGAAVKDRGDIRVRDAMSTDLLTVEPGQTLGEAARRMEERRVGSAAVVDPGRPWPGIITERDLLHVVAQGKDPKVETVAAHETSKVVIAGPDWPLERAAATMIRGHFRHLIVVEGRQPAGVISMRDIVRCWAEDAQD
jgi:CBS domain-containing protein